MTRFFDILFSSLAIIVLLPIIMPIILILKFTGEGEVFFLQERIGKDGNIFKLFKFATMLKNSPNIGTGTVTIKEDPRVLPFGKFLRKTKINELPQLFNILLGHMSVVGPRPMTVQTFDFYPYDKQEIIKEIRPGLSGIGSIIFRAEEEILQDEKTSVNFYSEVIAPYKGELEKWFYSNKSLYLYFLIIFITLWVVIIPNTKIQWRLFKDLPEPPRQLKNVLKFPN